MKHKIIFALVLLALAAIFIYGINQWFFLRKAHSTFENYYAFRGCAELIERTADYGICRTTDGQTIKIVKYHTKWYLDGDLPWACLGSTSICFGL